jgi:2-dehydropantoate 2-reductase
MRYLILGAGALGGYFGGRLAHSGADVSFLVRPRRASQLADTGLIVKAKDIEIKMPVTTLLAEGVTDHFDVIVLCCKAYDLDDAITAVSPAVGPNSAILPVLNGMRHIYTLSDRFGADRVLGGLTLVNAALSRTGEVVQSQVSLNTISCGELTGPVSARCHQIEKDFVAAGVAMSVSDDIVGQMWGKFFGIAAVAAVATVARARATAVANSTAGQPFVSAVIDECSRIVIGKGYPPPASMVDLVGNLYSNRDSNYGPSLLLDIEDGRPTEGEHIIGDMVQHATALGIDVPLLTAALCSIQSYEFQRATSPK